MQPTLPFPHTPTYTAAAWLSTKGTETAADFLQTLPVQSAGQGGAQVVLLTGTAATGKTHLLHLWAQQHGLQLPNPHIHDDLHKLDTAEQETLFHTYNKAQQTGHTLLLASRLAPVDLPHDFLPDLRSRLSTAVLLPLKLPTDTELAQILQKWLSERQLILQPQVVDYILIHATRNVGELHSLIALLDDMSLSEKRPLTIPLIKPYLQP